MILKDISGKYDAIFHFNDDVRSSHDALNDLNYIVAEAAVMEARHYDFGAYAEAVQYRDKERDKLSAHLESLTLDNLFGNLYTSGTREERKLLEQLVEETDRSVDYLFVLCEVDFHSALFHIIDTAVAAHPALANETVTPELLTEIFSAARALDSTVEYDSEKECMIYTMDANKELQGYLENNPSPTMTGVCKHLEHAAVKALDAVETKYNQLKEEFYDAQFFNYSIGAELIRKQKELAACKPLEFFKKNQLKKEISILLNTPVKAVMDADEKISQIQVCASHLYHAKRLNADIGKQPGYTPMPDFGQVGDIFKLRDGQYALVVDDGALMPVRTVEDAQAMRVQLKNLGAEVTLNPTLGGFEKAQFDYTFDFSAMAQERPVAKQVPSKINAPLENQIKAADANAQTSHSQPDLPAKGKGPAPVR